ncbi:MAG: hypothetical protein ACP5LN_10550 [Thermoproteota archaeon]
MKLRTLSHFILILTLTFLFCLTINQAGLHYYETVHRLSTYKALSFTLISGEFDRNLATLFLAISIIFSILELTVSKERDKRILTSVSFGLISLLFFILNYIFFSLVLFTIFVLSYLKLKNELWSFFENCFLFFIFVEGLSALRWATYPVFYSSMYSDLTWIFSKLDSFLFYSFNATLGSYIILFFIFSFPISILPFISIKLHGRKFLVAIHKAKNETKDIKIFGDEKVALIFSFFTLLYLSYYAYLLPLNPEGKFVSVDLVFYKEYLEKFMALGFNERGFSYLLHETGGGRATVVLLTYLFNIFLQNTAEAIKFSYFFASYLLVLSTFLSLRALTKNRTLATLSVYLSTFSIQTVVGLYAGYLANWIAISLLLLTTTSFSLAFKDRKYFFVSILFSTLALFSHPWSWTIVILATLLLFPLNFFLSKLKLRRPYNKEESLLVGIFFVVNLLLDALKQYFLNSLGGAYADYSITKSTFLISNMFILERNLNFLAQVFVGGYTTNVLVFLLSILGVAQLLKYDGSFFDVLFLILPIVAAPFMFVDAAIQSRLIYFLPLNVYSTLGFYEVLKKLEEKSYTIAFVLVLLLLNYSFRSVANLT